MRCAVNTLELPEPVLVLGASGFIGGHIFRKFQALGVRVCGVSSRSCDLAKKGAVRALLRRERPRLVVNCLGYGGYPSQNDVERILRVNVGIVAELLEALHEEFPETLLLHAGSSSEYGKNSAGPNEDAATLPDSPYAIAKRAAAELIQLYGETKNVRALNLRLYSVYGPGEPAPRLIPTLLEHVQRGKLPDFADPETSRDFVHVEDVVSAFLAAAASPRKCQDGRAYNIATGRKTTLRQLADLARLQFKITASPRFHAYPDRAWDRKDWYGNPKRAKEELGWTAKIDLESGLTLTVRTATPDTNALARPKLAVIVACYRDAESLEEIYRRLIATLSPLPVDYRSIFINDGSPDDTEKKLIALSRSDANVLGVTHSRNFGSQAAFRSGLDLLSADEACVFMDGDLQDPPELIAEFFRKWREGTDIVFGVRTTRDEQISSQVGRKLFYRLFRWASDTPMPLDAGDFGLLSPLAAKALKGCEERDLFLRGLRAFVGFSQVGVPYHRPARKHGLSTNSWLSNLEWAKRGLFSFGGKFLRGYFLLALVTDYLGRIFQEVKRRPLYIRLSRIEAGALQEWTD